MKIHTLSIIQNLRYTKLSDLYTYYYICLEESFMNLTENTKDLENVDTYIKEQILDNNSSSIDINILIKYFENNYIDVKKISDDILLISMQNDPVMVDLNNFKKYLECNGYRESCFKHKEL